MSSWPPWSWVSRVGESGTGTKVIVSAQGSALPFASFFQ